MTMPDSVKAFFDADQRGGPEALAAAFLDDAVVRDERTRREGLTAIRAWWTAAKAEVPAHGNAHRDDGNRRCDFRLRRRDGPVSRQPGDADVHLHPAGPKDRRAGDRVMADFLILLGRWRLRAGRE